MLNATLPAPVGIRLSLLISPLLLTAAALAADAVPSVSPAQITPAKRTALEWIDQNQARTYDISDRIWRAAETSLKEFKSSELLAKELEKAGFKVQRGVSGMDTAFVAEYGSGHPVIGILAEFDALPGLSQAPTTKKTPFEVGAPGHGCGHNLFGSASTAAAIAVQRAMTQQKLTGTIRLYGTPAEENYSGKTYMARDGLFNGLDLALHWHPDSETGVPQISNQALNGVEITFLGQSAHAAGNPWNGRSALDAVELLNISMNYLREHVPLSARIHYVITNGGAAPNIVPDRASVWYMIRDTERSGVEALHERLLDSAKGASLMTRTTYEVKILEAPWHVLISEAGSRLMYSNLLAIGPPQFTAEEHQFAKQIQQSLGIEQRGLASNIEPMRPPEAVSGTTDVADVSWVTPTIGLSVATSVLGDPGHNWSTVATGGMSIGHKGLNIAAKTIAATAIDVLQNPALLDPIKAEWQQKTKGIVYKSAIPEGQLPPKP